MAEEHRAARTRKALAELDRLRSKYPNAHSDFSTLRFLVPAKLSEEPEEGVSVEELLRTAGYRMRLIARGSPRPKLDEKTGTVAAPIMFWLKDADSVVIAEVYGHAALYSYGQNDDEAIRNVLLLMDGFHRDFVEQPPQPDSPAEHLRDFLEHVLG
jgi:hypothetical protein